MIFVTVGSQKFQFNRLVSAVDMLKGSGVITDEVFIQSGESDYIPRYCRYKHFLIVMILLELVDRVIYSSRMVAQGQLWVP